MRFLLVSGQRARAPETHSGRYVVHRGVSVEPDAALGTQKMRIPCKALHGKASTPHHLRRIVSSIFVHIEIRTKKLKERSWQGLFRGYNQDTKAHGIYNKKTQACEE